MGISLYFFGICFIAITKLYYRKIVKFETELNFDLQLSLNFFDIK